MCVCVYFSPIPIESPVHPYRKGRLARAWHPPRGPRHALRTMQQQDEAYYERGRGFHTRTTEHHALVSHNRKSNLDEGDCKRAKVLQKGLYIYKK